MKYLDDLRRRLHEREQTLRSVAVTVEAMAAGTLPSDPAMLRALADRIRQILDPKVGMAAPR